MIDDLYFIIGIDGGASNTRGILINSEGKTLSRGFEKGTNLNIFGELAAERIFRLIMNLCKSAKISFESLDAIGLGLAGASDQIGREETFKKMDMLNLSKKILITNDAEAAYTINCPGDIGFLITVGTGVICLSKDAKGRIIRTAGKGHYNGDIGSGFWLGKKMLENLILNESSILGDKDLEEIMRIVLSHHKSKNFKNIIDNINQHEDAVSIIANLAKPLIDLAEKKNDIALSIVHEATHSIANYIKNLTEEIEYNSRSIVLAGNGSVIENIFFRRCINEDLKFDFPDIKWTFSTISAAYGAAIMAAKIYEIDIQMTDILKGDPLASTSN